MPAGPSSSADGADSESDATATVTASRGSQHQRSGTLRQRPSGTLPPSPPLCPPSASLRCPACCLVARLLYCLASAVPALRDAGSVVIQSSTEVAMMPSREAHVQAHVLLSHQLCHSACFLMVHGVFNNHSISSFLLVAATRKPAAT